MNIKTELQSWKKKTITKSELESILHTNSDAELYELVYAAVADGVLSPVKSSGSNGNRKYPLYLKYRVSSDKDYTEVLSEIAMLHPLINKTGYLQSKPELYIQYKDQLQKLNRYLFKIAPSVAISKKERSFEIFDEEKQLEDSSFRNLLDHLGLTKDVLCYYDTPEYCFNDYISERKPRMKLLICENKDIWFNVRRRMYEDSARSIYGESIDGVVYGSGNRVTEKGALLEYTRFMNADNVEYLYWGDIDREGLNIYLSLAKNNPDINIQLFIPAYEEMLRLAEQRDIPDSRDHRERVSDYEPVYRLFPDELYSILSGIIQNNKRVPQEIINYETLLNVMR